jgi:hypothetical protein
MLKSVYKLSLLTSLLLVVTFSLGLARALADAGKIKVSFSDGFLYLHVTFAVISGMLSLALFKLAYNTDLLFPRLLASVNLIAIGIAGISGLTVLLMRNDLLATLMLYSFEVSFGVSSVLIGYLYCFYRHLSERC